MPFTGSTLTVMQTILNTIWNVVTALFGGVSNVVSVLMNSNNVILLIPTGIAIGYAIVKIFRRFIVSI